MNFIDLTHFVKLRFPQSASGGNLNKSLQFQIFKCFRLAEGILLYFEFYPGLSFLISKEGFLPLERSIPGRPIELPIRLYLKSYFINKRIIDLKLISANEATFLFSGDGLEMRFKKENEFLEIVMLVPGKKEYLQKIKLAAGLNFLQEIFKEAKAEVVSANKLEVPKEPPLDKKNQKLLNNIQQDIKNSSDWLDLFCAVFKQLLENPDWGDEEIVNRFSNEISTEIKNKQFKNIRDFLFKKKKKLEKRLEGSRKRFNEVEKKLSRGEKVAKMPLLKKSEIFSSDEIDPKTKPQKKPGIWVELAEGIWARIGKSALENGELFRQAKDRDLWFHVRGQKGAHIWVPRGQKGFGSKGEAPDWLIQKGCELAALNSKVKNSGSADCDFTERRYLKAIKGAGPGQLEILRSKTRFVRIKI